MCYFQNQSCNKYVFNQTEKHPGRWCASVGTKRLELSFLMQGILSSVFCPNLDRSYHRGNVLIKKVTYLCFILIAGSALLSDHQKANGFVKHTKKVAKKGQVPLFCTWGTCDWRAPHVLELCKVQLCRFLKQVLGEYKLEGCTFKLSHWCNYWFHWHQIWDSDKQKY